jgi:sarcosine oxidase subunit beta
VPCRGSAIGRKPGATPSPKPRYDIIIVGGGGHGLATAYYLAKNHGIANVAVIERGWIGGGNTGRNTTIVRSNYLFPESARLYDFSLQLYEGLSQALNFNIMLSQRGLVMLAHSRHDLDAMSRWANAMRMNGIAAELLTRDEVGALAPALDLSPQARLPVLGGFTQRRAGTARHDAVAWGYARAASALGVDIIQNCEVVDFLKQDGRVVGVNTSRGRIGAERVGIAAAGHSSVLAKLAGFRLPGDQLCAAGHGERTHQAGARHGDSVAGHGRLRQPVGQGRNRHGRHARLVSILCAARQLRRQAGHHCGHPRIVSVLQPLEFDAPVGRHRRCGARLQPHHRPTPIPNLFINCGWGTGGFKAIPVGGWTLAHVLATGKSHRSPKPFNSSDSSPAALSMRPRPPGSRTDDADSLHSLRPPR